MHLSLKEIEKITEPLLVGVENTWEYQNIVFKVVGEVTQRITQQVTMDLTLKRIQKVAEAKREIQREIALQMLRKKMAPKLVAELTGLFKQDVLELRQTLGNGSKPRKPRKSGK